MEQLNPSDLKAILHSKRANVYYLEYCRVMQLRNQLIGIKNNSSSSLPCRQLKAISLDKMNEFYPKQEQISLAISKLD